MLDNPEVLIRPEESKHERVAARTVFGRLLMGLGMASVLGAVLLLAYNHFEAESADRESGKVLSELTAVLQVVSEEGPPLSDDRFDAAMRPMTVVDIDGYGYVGYLSIPALGLELPIMSEWDGNYDRLRIAPCRQFGTAAAGGMVIAGHNYLSHFGRLKDLQPGAEMVFVDMDGNVYTYRVAMLEILDPYDVAAVENSPWDLTLYTCTYGGESRVTVRCERV